MAHRRRGRIRRLQRDTDDTAAILGIDQALPDDYEAVLNETMKYHRVSDKCKRDYRRRIKRIVDFWRDKVPAYYSVGVREVPDEEYFNDMKWYYPDPQKNFKYDIIYPGLNEKHFIYFLDSTKVRDDGMLCGDANLRKYKDAIQWAARERGDRLPSRYYENVESFLSSYKKEYEAQKKMGNMENNSADPINISLYERILKWALEENNIFVWHWTQTQWNLMSRSANISSLHIDNFRLGTDSIIWNYDDSKYGKKAEKLPEKIIYSHPFDFRMCYWTGLGIYCALRGEERWNNNRNLFLEKGVKEKTARHKYCEQLSSVTKRHQEELQSCIKVIQFHPDGFGKGAATYAASVAAMAPSIPSFVRNEYLGRVVAGLDPNNDNKFDVLPPHWTVKHPMLNISIRTGMEMTFGNILLQYPMFTKILVRSLACIVHHSEQLIKQMFAVPGHDFIKINILQDRVLLKELKELVTMEPTPGVLTKASGIPPHVEHSRKLCHILNGIHKIKECQESLQERIIDGVTQVLHECPPDSDQVSMGRFVSIIDEKLDTLRQAVKKITRGNSRDAGDTSQNNQGRTADGDNDSLQAADLFAYGGRLNFIPPNFKFPRATIKQGMAFWFRGMVASADGKKRIRPFRKITWRGFPPKAQALKRDFAQRWKMFFSYLEQHVEVPPLSPTASEEELNLYYEKCKEVLKTRVSYYYGDGTKLRNQISSWSKAICSSEIVAKGTPSDKALLSNNVVKPRKKHKRKGRLSSSPRHPLRQKRRLEKLNRVPEKNTEDYEEEPLEVQNRATVSGIDGITKESAKRARAQRKSKLALGLHKKRRLEKLNRDVTKESAKRARAQRKSKLALGLHKKRRLENFDRVVTKESAKRARAQRKSKLALKRRCKRISSALLEQQR